MPAQTIEQLHYLLGDYVDPRMNFVSAMAQVVPRLYSLGMWKDLVYEISLDGSNGYVSLPVDAESVLAITVNDLPRSVRSMWHDIKIVGRAAVPSVIFGAIDDGFHPVLLDMVDVQGVDSVEDLTPVDSLFVVNAGTFDHPTDFSGTVTLITNNSTNDSRQTIISADDTVDVKLEGGFGFTEVFEIRYENLEIPVDVVSGAGYPYPRAVVATLPVGSGVARFRRFRVNNTTPETTLHLLVKRASPAHFNDNTVIHLANLGAIKHGLLGMLAEDNADLDRATYHWNVATQILDAELDAFRGAGRPTIVLNLWGGSPAPYGIY